jgi:L-lactate utilization protein LutC
VQQAREEGGGPTAANLPPSNPTPDALHPSQLREHLHRLKDILSVISVAATALRRQNAELDDDIATVLDQHAGQPLDLEIETLESTLRLLAKRRVKELVA